MDSLPLLRTLHIAGAVLLLGNVAVTGFWATFLYRARSTVPFQPVARAIMWADLIFTLAGGVLLTVSGILLTMRQGYQVWETAWLLKGIVALGVSTLLWLVVLLPDQWRLERLTCGDDAALRRIFLRWSVVGWGATLVLFYGLWAMVGKR
ncbi:MAG: DUF2269 family protein [Gemmatimonadales bacterium]|nr:DUF2269 family protein [Gemmatimonadales bacterium]